MPNDQMANNQHFQIAWLRHSSAWNIEEGSYTSCFSIFYFLLPILLIRVRLELIHPVVEKV